LPMRSANASSCPAASVTSSGRMTNSELFGILKLPC
jgi:hypothetical protein